VNRDEAGRKAASHILSDLLMEITIERLDTTRKRRPIMSAAERLNAVGVSRRRHIGCTASR
jgi:hypothetical protein